MIKDSVDILIDTGLANVGYQYSALLLLINIYLNVKENRFFLH